MKELRDQAAHFAASFAIVSLSNLLGGGNILSGLLIGLSLGLVREITEEGEVSIKALRSALHSKLDLSFWALGGATAGLVA